MARGNEGPEGQRTAVLRLTRRFAAPREAVFRALTEPEALARWFGPEGVRVRDVKVDPRPGGRYSMDFHETDGEVHPLSGTYREVRAPERLVLTWTWAKGGMAGIETLVTIELREADGGTELVLTHEGLPSAEARNLHEKGWRSTFDCLDRLVAEGGLS